jgi:GNAT superfamily N-acetyltransferase
VSHQRSAAPGADGAHPLSGPMPMAPHHLTGSFSCGAPSLDEYLLRRALGDQRAEKSRTYVASRDNHVVAYFTLAAGAVGPEAAPARVAKGQGRQPVPVILLARLAVDEREQGKRLGEAMLLEALARSAEAAETIGARAVLVHAKDDEARSFYRHYGFEPSPTDPLHLMLLMKDIRRSLRP